MKKESKSVAEIVTEKVLDRIAEAEAKGEVFHWVRPYDFYGGLDNCCCNCILNLVGILIPSSSVML